MISVYPKNLTYRVSFISTVLLVIAAVLAPTFVAAAQPIDRDNTQTITPKTTAGLQAFFQALDYERMQFENGAPPFILERIPAYCKTVRMKI